jgi:hypothetical protein
VFRVPGVLRVFLLAAGWVLAAPGCGAALLSGRVPIPFLSPRGEPPIRTVVVTRRCGDSGTVRGKVLALGAGLLCGIGGSQKRAAFGIGCENDTLPRFGCCTATWGCCA